MSERPKLVVVPGDAAIRALEALRAVRDEYGLPTLGKPCLAYVLDGNTGAAARHDCSFIIAIEMRALGLTERETEKILTKWATKIGHRPRQAHRAIRNAYMKAAGGGWRYHAPGVVKKPGTLRAYDVLGPICADIGCPAGCPAYADVHRGPRGEGIDQFEKLGWPAWLRKHRHAAAADFYRAIVELEQEHGFAAGAPLLTSYRRLGELADRSAPHAGDNLRVLHIYGLLAVFERGSGSGPHARDRKPSRVQRQVPIPATPTTAITTGDRSSPWIGSRSAPGIGDDPGPHIGDRSATASGSPDRQDSA